MKKRKFIITSIVASLVLALTPSLAFADDANPWDGGKKTTPLDQYRYSYGHINSNLTMAKNRINWNVFRWDKLIAEVSNNQQRTSPISDINQYLQFNEGCLAQSGEDVLVSSGWVTARLKKFNRRELAWASSNKYSEIKHNQAKELWQHYMLLEFVPKHQHYN